MQFPLKNIKELSGQLKGKKIIVRATLNVPINNGRVVDDFRIQKFIPTLDFLIKEKAKILIISHLSEKGASLLPVFDYLKKNYDITFVKKPEEINLEENNLLLLDNLRLFNGEIENNPDFARKIASFGNIYLNEAFPDSHRKHTSIIGLPNYLPSYIGDLFENEINNLEKILNPQKPFIAILGGKKASTKIPLIEKILDLADEIFIGGALVHNFLKAEGKEIGQSIYSDKNLIKPEWLNNPKIYLPKKFVVLKENKKTEIKSNIQKDEMIVDTDLDFIKTISQKIKNAKTIFWNGPFGFCEKGFNQGTKFLAKTITKSNGFSVVGGGASISEIRKYGLEKEFDFVSTGGGASLSFIANGTLPGIEAILNKK